MKSGTSQSIIFWMRESDLNQRPSGYEPDELPDCSIPHQRAKIIYKYRKKSM